MPENVFDERIARVYDATSADRFEVTPGDFATTDLGRTFRLVYLVDHTITNLITQDEQVECFRNVDGQLEQFSSTHRYVWPAELDLMARLADMQLIERWADWDRSPFTADSDHHVSVWEKPE